MLKKMVTICFLVGILILPASAQVSTKKVFNLKVWTTTVLQKEDIGVVYSVSIPDEFSPSYDEERQVYSALIKRKEQKETNIQIIVEGVGKKDFPKMKGTFRAELKAYRISVDHPSKSNSYFVFTFHLSK